MNMIDPDETRDSRAWERTLLFGVAVWLLLAAGTWVGRFRLEFVEILFLTATWVVVPAGTRLVPKLHNSMLRRWGVMGAWPQFLAAALATLSFLLPQGRNAGLLAAAWLLVCVAWALDGLLRILEFRARSFTQLCFAAGEMYLAVGGAWLAASRLGMQPAGFAEPIVLLTAVHFHFAGFLCCVFAGRTYQRIRDKRWAGPIRNALLGTVLGPGLLAIGFMVGPKVKLLAAMLVVIGQCGLAVGMTRVAWENIRSVSGIALQASAICVVAGMALAALWALGEYPLHPFADLSRMERIHGTLNAIGFGALGLIGWTSIHPIGGKS
jgi:hypothetical protein